MSDQSSQRTERSEKRESAFQWDFAQAMWDELPEDAKERLRESESHE